MYGMKKAGGSKTAKMGKMAGKVAGTGQVGAGLVTPPMEAFTAAIAGLATRIV